jgi:hypothetical protein
MRASELAKKVGLTRTHIARIAETIPAHRITKGGHHYFLDCPELQVWIKKQIQKRVRVTAKKLGLPVPAKPRKPRPYPPLWFQRFQAKLPPETRTPWGEFRLLMIYTNRIKKASSRSRR